MKKFPTQFWLVVLLLGWLFDFLFWKHNPGISFAIYALVTLTAGFILLWLDGLRPSRKTLLLLPFILFFAAITFIRREPLTAFLAHAFTLFLMAGLVVSYRGGRWMEYSLADYFARGFDLLGSAIVRAGAFSAELRRLKRETGNGEKKPGPFWPVVRGLLIALPVGVLSARKPYSFLDYLFTSLSFMGQSVPIYWLGLVMILIFYVWLNNPFSGAPLMPSGGMYSLGGEKNGSASNTFRRSDSAPIKRFSSGGLPSSSPSPPFGPLKPKVNVANAPIGA